MSDLRDKVSRLSIKAEEECDTADCYDAVMDEIISLCQPQWISVETAIPEHGEYVLTYGDVEGFRLISAGSLNSVGNGLPCGVTHWQIPTPPKVSK